MYMYHISYFTRLTFNIVFQNTSNIIVSMIHETDIETLRNQNVTPLNSSLCHWTEERTENCRDYDIPGVTVFRGYTWMFRTILAGIYFSVLKTVYHTTGLVRKMCVHIGSFYMEGQRQTCMASSSMTSPASEGTSSHYYNPKTMRTALLPLFKGIINFLGEEALQHQQSCGIMLLSLLRVSLTNIDSSIGITTAGICIFNILTYNFANSNHRDSDKMQQKCSDAVKDLITQSGLPKLTRWLNSFHQLFGDEERLPLPTTCCWSLMKHSEEWIHMQYFVLLDMHVAYDISSDVMVDIGLDEQLGQAGATFYGPLIDHCTSAPLWVSKDGSKVTIICPDDECFNAAWGRAGGDSEATKARKAAEKEKRRQQKERNDRAEKRSRNK